MASRDDVNTVFDWINTTEAMYRRLQAKERIAAAAMCAGKYTPAFGVRTFRHVVNATAADLAQSVGTRISTAARAAAAKQLATKFEKAARSTLHGGRGWTDLASNGAAELLMSPRCRRNVRKR